MRERKRPQAKRTLADNFGQFFDRCLYAVWPAQGLQRMAARRKHQQACDRQARGRDVQDRTYDGAETSQTRGRSWIGSRLSPDSGLEEDLESLREHSRELCRTEAIGGSVDTRVNLVVSYGFTPQAGIKARQGWITEAQAKLWNEQLEELYKRWSPRCDLSGRESLWMQLRLVERHYATDGEAFVILSDIGGADKPIPLTIEVVDPVRVETPPEQAGNPLVRMGIEYNAQGQIVAYHIRQTHPGDTRDVNMKYDRLAAARVLHIFEKWAAGQSRGLPWLTRTINRVKDIQDVDEASRIAEQVRACFAAFVTTESNPMDVALNAATDTDGRQYFQDIHPGTFHYMNDKEKVNFPQSSSGSQLGEWLQWQYRRVAGAMNFPYEMLAKNWGGLSFAAGRLSLSDARLFVKSQQKALVEQILMPIWARMVDEAVMVGEVEIPPRLWKSKPWLFQTHMWGAPAWPYALTPGEEIDAWVTAIDENLATKAEACAEFGRNWEDVAAQRKKERQQERDDNTVPTKGKPEVDPATAAKQAKAPQRREQARERMAA